MTDSLAYKFTIDDHQTPYSHFMLCHHDTAMKIRDARDAMLAGKEPSSREYLYTATVFIEGVQIPAEVINSELKRWYSGLEERIRSEFTPEGFEKRVEEEVRKRIKDRADGVIELLDNLRDKLQDADDLIKPYWDR